MALRSLRLTWKIARNRLGSLIVNGRRHDVNPQPYRSLLAVLREELGLTGAKYGCGEGACGACTVLLDGEPVRSCVTPIAQASGRSVTTVEGLADEGLHPVQRAFLEEGAMQCGYCTPGMVMSAVALLQESPHPNEARIVQAMNGNVCRCCAYPRIVRAILRAAEGGTLSAQYPVGRADEASSAFSRPAVPWDLTDPEDRDWFDVLPEGLIVLLPPDVVPDAWTAGGGTWIHVGTDGVVTAFTGKVDVGQDNRTALAQLVAEELRLPAPSVRVVMGDTDLCPWDAGTFGSRSIPDAGPVLAAAAAGTRGYLLDLAAERLEVDAGDLEVADGRIAVRGTDRSTSFGELVDGLHRVEIVRGRPETTPPDRWRVTGAALPKLQAEEAVTGERRFSTDLSLPGMLHGRVFRPPSHGATLAAVDVSGAEALGDVTVVNQDGFVGVATPGQAGAERALEAIRSEWGATRQPGEGELEAHLRAHPVHQEGWGGEHLEERGDVDSALAEAEVRLDATYTTAYIQHVPMETRAAVAQWEGERLTVWTGTQRPFGVREELAEALGVREEHVRVIVPRTGTGFGGKHSGDAAVEAARLAWAARRPVKVRWSRQEEFTWAYFRPAAVIDVRSGASRDGRLRAWEFTNINSGAAGIGLPYDVEHVRIRYQPADGPLPQGSYRALAATANAFARESHLDELADAVGVDPVELRLRNLSDERLGEVLRAAADRAGWAGRRVLGDGRGMGIGLGWEKDGRVATVAEVSVGPDGRVAVERIVTAYDCGAIVSPDNVRNQIEGATIMGLGGALFERIRFENGQILNASLNEYRVPRFADVPEIEVVLIDRKDEPPAGAGETPIIAVAPAIANAIFAATGRRIRSMPLAPDGLA
jgi:nicotinate dehydrogenase subunit B